MKNYESENQVGYGQTYEAYLDDLKSIFKDILSITKENESLWIIIDTFKRNNQVVTLPFDLSGKLKEIRMAAAGCDYLEERQNCSMVNKWFYAEKI